MTAYVPRHAAQTPLERVLADLACAQSICEVILATLDRTEPAR